MRKTWIILSALIFAGFVVRLLLLQSDFVINPDGVAYTGLARRFAAGDWGGFLDPYWTPLYPLLMSPVMIFTADPELPGQLVSIIFSTLLPLPVFLFVRQLYTESEGLTAAALAAFYAHYLNTALGITPSSLYYFLVAWIIWAGWRALQSAKVGPVFLLGALLGLAYLTRPEAIGYVPIYAVLVLGGFFSDEKLSFPRKTLLTAGLVCSFLAVSLPYLVYLKQATGIWTVSAKIAPHLIGGNFSEVSAFGTPQNPPGSLTESIRTIVSTLIFNLHKQHKIFAYLFPPLLIALAALGLFGRKWPGERRRHELYLLLLFAATVLAYVLTVVELIYLATYLVILFAWTARGITQMHHWSCENFPDFRGRALFLSPRGTFFSVIGVIFVLIYLLPVLGIFRNASEEREFVWLEIKRAGVQLKNQVSPDDKIMSFATQLPFYAGCRYIPLKAADEREMLERALNEKVDYIAVSERTEKEVPGLKKWLDGDPGLAGVQEVYRDPDCPGCKLIIYRLIK